MPENQTSQDTPYLDEHQPRGYGGTFGADESLDPQREETGKLVEKIWTEAKKGREPYLDKKGMDFYKFYRGEQWLEPLPDYLATETVNLTYADIRTILALLTDSHPQITTLPTETTDATFAEVLKHLIDFKWSKCDWGRELYYTCLDKLIYSSGFWRIEWDRSKEDGIGDILLEAVDPYQCFPDPYCTDINAANSRYFIYAEPVLLSELKLEYPQYKDKFKADLEMFGKIREQRQNVGDVEVKESSYDEPMVASQDGTGQYDEGWTLKIHCWLKDEAVEEFKSKTEAGDEQVEMRKKYPNGRYICKAGGVVVEDKENWYEHGMFPFVRFANNPLPREFWGVSEVEVRQSLQRMLNRLASHWINHVELQDNPIWIVDTNAAIDVENLMNEMGLIVEKAPGSEVRREGGTPMPSHIFQIYDRLRKEYDAVGGIHEAIRGRLESGVTSGLMLQSLQEAAQATIRLQERYMKQSLSQAGRMIVSLILQFYTEPRIFRITNQNLQQHVQFQSSPQDEQGNRQVSYRDINSNEGQTATIKGLPDVKVTTGIGMPFAKTIQADKALQYYNAQLIDREAALKMSDIENWEEINQRMTEREQQLAEMQARQEAAGAA